MTDPRQAAYREKRRLWALEIGRPYAEDGGDPTGRGHSRNPDNQPLIDSQNSMDYSQESSNDPPAAKDSTI